MSEIQITFPAGDKRAAEVFGEALARYANENAAIVSAQADSGDDPDAESFADLHKTPELPEEPAPSGRDANGVEFDAAYCSKAAKPFVSTGKRKGQWKRKKGVEEADFNEWYEQQLSNQEQSDAPPSTSGSMFADSPALIPGEQQTPAPAPVTVQELIQYSTSQQVLGNITSEAFNDALAALGKVPLDLQKDPALPAQVKSLLQQYGAQ